MENDILEKAKNPSDRLLEGESSINQIRNEFELKSIDDKSLNKCCRQMPTENKWQGMYRVVLEQYNELQRKYNDLKIDNAMLNSYAKHYHKKHDEQIVKIHGLQAISSDLEQQNIKLKNKIKKQIMGEYNYQCSKCGKFQKVRSYSCCHCGEVGYLCGSFSQENLEKYLDENEVVEKEIAKAVE